VLKTIPSPSESKLLFLTLFERLRYSANNSFSRDTTKQVRASEDLICDAVLNLVAGSETWQDVAKKLPTFEGQEVD
jgi:hypothetical protein